MPVKSQNVLDSPNFNTIFMVWNFKKDTEIKEAFQKICKYISNLNNSANTRFPDTETSIVLGIRYEAWQLLDLPNRLFTSIRAKDS